MKQEYLISIIVPIFNVEKYIKKCVDSIINQSYKNLEIILVDDGSCDSCGEICDQYKISDKRVKVIHKKNGGLSDARNIGLLAATGDFIAFVDGDDYISSDMYETLLSNLIMNKADISACKAVVVSEKENANFIKSDDLHVINKNIDISLIYDKKITVNMWNKLYKKELFENIKFPKGMIYEDLATTYKIIDISKKIVLTDSCLYAYVQRHGSIMNLNSMMISVDKIMIVNEMWNYFEYKGYKYTKKNKIRAGIIVYCINDIFKMLKCESLKINKNYIDRLKEFLKKKKLSTLLNPYLSFYYKFTILFGVLFPRTLQRIYNFKFKRG